MTNHIQTDEPSLAQPLRWYFNFVHPEQAWTWRAVANGTTIVARSTSRFAHYSAAFRDACIHGLEPGGDSAKPAADDP